MALDRVAHRLRVRREPVSRQVVLGRVEGERRSNRVPPGRRRRVLLRRAAGGERAGSEREHCAADDEVAASHATILAPSLPLVEREDLALLVQPDERRDRGWVELRARPTPRAAAPPPRAAGALGTGGR